MMKLNFLEPSTVPQVQQLPGFSQIFFYFITLKVLKVQDITSHFDFSSLVSKARKREHCRKATRHGILQLKLHGHRASGGRGGVCSREHHLIPDVTIEYVHFC